VQEAFEENMLFDMGQLLSVPFMIVGGWCMMKGLKKVKKL
jgi:prolipoprotein diacylglyceryltransferase